MNSQERLQNITTLALAIDKVTKLMPPESSLYTVQEGKYKITMFCNTIYYLCIWRDFQIESNIDSINAIIKEAKE